MNSQILQGLFDPSSSQEHSQALNYLEQLKEDPNAWRNCVEMLATNSQNLDDKAKFVFLQILERYVKSLYSLSSSEDQLFLRQKISQWLSTVCLSNTPEKLFIRNKTAQLLALIFVVDYLERWPTFMDDLISFQDQGKIAVDIYLKVLLAIDAEIVDRDMIHSQFEAERNSKIKDAMRERNVVSMANSWYNILVKNEQSHPKLVCHCHDVIGAFISWIDINIIANDRFVSILVNQLNNLLLQETAADCIIKILQKDMEPLVKTHLVESFYTVLGHAGVFTPAYDSGSDFLPKLSKLVSCLGCQLISAFNKVDKNFTDNREAIRLAIENKVPLILQFMANKYDDVSALAFDFFRDYMQMIKETGMLTDPVRGQLENMLFVCITKSKLDESYNFEQDGEDEEEEANFIEYRRSLRGVFNSLATLVPDLVLKVCKDYVTTTLNIWQNFPYEEVEAAVYLIYCLKDALPVLQDNHFSTAAQCNSSVIKDMMNLLISSGVSSHTHPAVVYQFFECIVKYEKNSFESRLIPIVLEAFLDHRGMRNKSIKIRSRTAFLFFKFVRWQNSHLVNYSELILSQVSDLLILCLPERDQTVPQLSNDDQLYVYEACAILIIASNLLPAQKEILMRKLLSPVFEEVPLLVERLANEQMSVTKLAIATSICHATLVTARTSKAFSNYITMKTCQCIQVYKDAVQLFIRAMNVGVERDVIGTGLQRVVHRMIVCLEKADLKTILPVVSQALLQTPSVKALVGYLILIIEVITTFKREMCDFVRDIFTPLLNAIFASFMMEIEPNNEDDLRSRKFLQKSYFLFLNLIVSQGLHVVFTSQDSGIVQQVLMSTVQGAFGYDDLVGQRHCFMFLKRLIDIWGNGKDSPAEFINFIYTQIVPACFMAPLKSNFDLNDAQSILTLHEIAMCLKSIHNKQGEHLITFLRSDFLPKRDLPVNIIEEFCQALVSDPKLFRNYVKFFFQQAKS